MFKRILVALDDEPTMAAQVMTEAIALAQVNGAGLNIVHVLFPLNSGNPDPMYMTLDGAFTALNTEAFGAYVVQWQALKQKNQKNLETYVAEAQAAGLTAEATQIIGEPNRQICALAKTWPADLIIMGRRGIQGLGELLMGSVSSYVMHRAPCSVLMVQGESHH